MLRVVLSLNADVLLKPSFGISSWDSVENEIELKEEARF